MAASCEEQVEDWCKRQLKGVHVFAKTEFINAEITKALHDAPSKKGGKGANYPDIKCLIEPQTARQIPVLIEVKGLKGALVKKDASGDILNETASHEPNYAHISKYAVNGAVHYARAIVKGTQSYKEALAIGVNGYKEESTGALHTEMEVWYVSTKHFLIPIQLTPWSDLSFLNPTCSKYLLNALDKVTLTDEQYEKKKSNLEDEIERNLKDINQLMHDQMGIVVNQRVQLITGLVMAGLGVPGEVAPLKIEDLTGEGGVSSNDGKRIMDKIDDYLKHKNLPSEKIEMIEGILSNVFIHSKLQVKQSGGESKLKGLYREVSDKILPFLADELHNIDFTGRLFNVLNEWVDVPDGAQNDVVLTPRYVTKVMAQLCLVDENSYVWDFATGSAGFLISAMDLMIGAAQKKIKDPDQLSAKITHIKMEQLLGIEKLSDVYMLAVLNMILMKDGSANIIHGDSLKDFKGVYGQGDHKDQPFPATVFLLNPPYSADGKGFVFVKKALSLMKPGGRAAVLIQENAGSGAALPYTQEILEHNTLLASIHMGDIFCGKASVQTAIYVFDVGHSHDTKTKVKFIDFSNDGYTRSNRHKSSQKVNLRDTDHAAERYQELVDVVSHGKDYLHYFKDCYVEDTISLKGNDWTYAQHRKIDTTPTLDDFKNVVKEYLAWRVSEVIKQEGTHSLGKHEALG